MKEVVFTKPPYMNGSEQRIADMHTVLNILNILVGELSMVDLEQPQLREKYSLIDSELTSISGGIKEGGDLVSLLKRLRESEPAVKDFLKKALEDASDEERVFIEETVSNLESVYSILRHRLDELDLRVEDPDLWVQFLPDDFRGMIEDVFVAIAKNSKGRYGIRFNLAQKGESDYYLDLKMEASRSDGSLWVPLRLVDVLRDLTANARKYTAPGGKVALAVYQDEDEILAVVEDSGCGIPEDELDKVAEFGYRASNVRSSRTMGGGFGLTKAVWLVTKWGGKLSIESEVDRGTTVKISFPNKG